MLRKPFFVAIVLSTALLFLSSAAMAQRRGGGASSSPAGNLESYSRPDGVDEKDELKDFHDAMALQATAQQAAEFQSALKSTEVAKTELQALVQALGKSDGAESAHLTTVLDQALANARTANNTFQGGFSPEQKNGLRDALRRLAKTDSDLDLEQKKLNQSLIAKNNTVEVNAGADRLEKIVSDFYDQQLAMGRKMSIVLSSALDTNFVLTQVRVPVRFSDQTISVPTSGMLSQVAAQSGGRTFHLDLISSLLDLQQNMTEVASAALNRVERCGDHVEVRQATLIPGNAAGLLSVRLHYERWMCMRNSGPVVATELAEDDGVVEIKLTVSVEKQGELKVATELGRIDATGVMADSLRNGSLGDDLRVKAAHMILSAAQTATNLKAVLPPAVQNSAQIQSARFEETGVGALSVVFGGQVEISDEQAKALASQLNQALSTETPTQQ
jgi:hypothetical protein